MSHASHAARESCYDAAAGPGARRRSGVRARAAVEKPGVSGGDLPVSRVGEDAIHRGASAGAIPGSVPLLDVSRQFICMAGSAAGVILKSVPRSAGAGHPCERAGSAAGVILKSVPRPGEMIVPSRKSIADIPAREKAPRVA